MSVGFFLLTIRHHDTAFSQWLQTSFRTLVLTPINLENRMPAHKSATVKKKVERGRGSQKPFYGPKARVSLLLADWSIIDHIGLDSWLHLCIGQKLQNPLQKARPKLNPLDASDQEVQDGWLERKRRRKSQRNCRWQQSHCIRHHCFCVTVTRSSAMAVI